MLKLTEIVFLTPVLELIRHPSSVEMVMPVIDGVA